MEAKKHTVNRELVIFANLKASTVENATLLATIDLCHIVTYRADNPLGS